MDRRQHADAGTGCTNQSPGFFFIGDFIAYEQIRGKETDGLYNSPRFFIARKDFRRTQRIFQKRGKFPAFVHNGHAKQTPQASTAQ